MLIPASGRQSQHSLLGEPQADKGLISKDDSATVRTYRCLEPTEKAGHGSEYTLAVGVRNRNGQIPRALWLVSLAGMMRFWFRGKPCLESKRQE